MHKRVRKCLGPKLDRVNCADSALIICRTDEELMKNWWWTENMIYIGINAQNLYIYWHKCPCHACGQTDRRKCESRAVFCWGRIRNKTLSSQGVKTVKEVISCGDVSMRSSSGFLLASTRQLSMIYDWKGFWLLLL